MKRLVVLLFLLLFLSFGATQSFADYVLPYPSAMPGGISYKVHSLWEKISQYWYFGNFGQFEYNLKESDKYLVEAKTLFEYQQYLLGYNALLKSDMYFVKTLPYLQKAKYEGKPITDKRLLLHEATLKHREVLKRMMEETPETFNWQPEKTAASVLQLHNAITNAIQIRMKYL